MFLRKTEQSSEIFFEDKVVGLADIVDNQYVICLAKSLVLKIKVVKNPTLDIWYAWLGYLSYGGMQKLTFVALGIELKDSLLLKICGGYMVGKQQWQSP